jgi:hypothetical protein
LLPGEPSAAFLGVIQPELRAYPQAAVAVGCGVVVARNGPDGFAAETFMGGPILPLAIAQPTRQTGPEESQPDGSFAVLKHRGDVIGGQPLLGIYELPASGEEPRQPAVGGHQQVPCRIER